MIVDITNELLGGLRTLLPTVKVETSYPSTTPTFPLVTIEEISNIEDIESVDTSGGHYSQIAIEINIYTNSSKKMTDAKEIRNSIDGYMSDTNGLSRDFSSATPNYLDLDVYRYTLRYSCYVDSSKVIYRR